jgi:hypothetical protein
VSLANKQGPYGPSDFSAQQAAGGLGDARQSLHSEKLRVAELISDSAQPSAVTGVRASNAQARQLLYRMGSLCVDVCMQPELGSLQIMLVGQLLDSQEPGHGLGDIPVSLLCEDIPISQNRTNAVGEFCFGFRALHDAQLVFGIGEDKILIVPVPDTDA